VLFSGDLAAVSYNPLTSTKAGGFENRPSLSSKNHVHLVIYTLHAFKTLKLDTNPILLKLKYLDSAASALSKLYL
jgi:hypothetical protein